MGTRGQRILYLAIAAGLALSVAVQVVLRRHESRVIGSHLAVNAQLWGDALLRSIELHLEALHSMRAVGERADGVEPLEFQRAAAAALARHEGLVAMQWLPRVPGTRRAAVEQAARDEGSAGFRIFERDAGGRPVPAADRDEYFPILVAEPNGEDGMAPGFDLGSNPAIRQALDAARATKEMRASAPLELGAGDTGFVVALPLFDPPTAGPVAPADPLRGFVVAVFRTHDLVREADRGAAVDVTGLELEIDDENAPAESRTLFARRSAEQRARSSIGPAAVPLVVAGRTWTLQAEPTAAYVAARRGARPAVALLVGVVLTSLVGGVLALAGRRTRAVARLVDERTADLQQQTTLLQSVLDNLADGVAVADESGRLVMFNPAAKNILGVDMIDSGPDEWSRLYGLFHTDQETPFEPAELPLARAVAGLEAHDVEMFVRNPENVRGIFIRVTATPIRDAEGQVRGGVAVFRDITEPRWSQQALRDSEERFRSIVEATGSALIILSPEYRVLEFNPEAERIYGRSRAAVLGEDYLQQFIPREYWGVVAEDVQHALSGRNTVDLEIPIRTGHGTTRILLMAISRLASFGGGVLGVVATAHDVTERREAEEAQRVRQLAAHLQSAREGERKHAAREIHDELGQVLTGLKFSFSHLARRLSGVDPEVHKEIASLEALIDSTIGSVRRIAAELRPQILDHLGLLEAIRWQAREFEKRTGIICALELPDDELDWSADRAIAVFRIFQESLTNIARHSGAKHVRVRVQRAAGQIVLEVRDDGRGIRAEELASVRSFGVLGMQERARMFGGVLTVRGADDGGTTVRVQIPL